MMYHLCMNWRHQNLKMFGLTDTETAILKAAASLKNVKEIVEFTGISRTGVNYCLTGLIDKGYINITRRDGIKYYEAIKPEALNATILKTLGTVVGFQTRTKGARVDLDNRGEFIIHVGLDEVIPAYERIATKSKDIRIRAIQHHRSWNELLKKITPERLKKFNDAVKKNHLIIDGVLNESAYKAYYDEIMSDPVQNKAAVESLSDRMADYTVFPDKFFNYDTEIWIYRNTTLAISWRQETATEIRNADMTGFFRDMFDLMKMAGRKIDHNKLMKELAASLKSKN